MDWKITYDKDLKYVHACKTGQYSLDGEVSFLNAIFASPFWRSGTPLIIDYRSFEMSNVNDRVIDTVRKLMTLLKEKLGNGRLALLCGDEEQYTAGKQFQTTAAQYLDAEIDVFLDEQAAVDWVSHKTSEITASSKNEQRAQY